MRGLLLYFVSASWMQNFRLISSSVRMTAWWSFSHKSALHRLAVWTMFLGHLKGWKQRLKERNLYTSWFLEYRWFLWLPRFLSSFNSSSFPWTNLTFVFTHTFISFVTPFASTIMEYFLEISGEVTNLRWWNVIEPYAEFCYKQIHNFEVFL